MPIFNFSLVPNKKNKRKPTTHDINRYETIKKHVTGIVFIKLTADYEVSVNGKRYDIKKECYSCKGRSYVYTHLIHTKERVCCIRDKSNLCELNTSFWLPFIEGCRVVGNIVKDVTNNKEFFHVSRVYPNYLNSSGNSARRFYEENYCEIKDAIIKKRFDAIQ